MSTETESAPRQRPLAYRLLRVSAVRRLSPHLTRITFGSDELDGFTDVTPDQSVKLFFPLDHQVSPKVPELSGDDVMSWYQAYLAMPDDVRPPMRTYTVRYHRPARREIDVDFVLHGEHGPASRFASNATPGQHVGMLGPGGSYQPPSDCGWQLLAGDETALPAIGAITEALPKGMKALVYVEIGDDRDRQRFETAGDVEINWVRREGVEAGRSDRLLRAVQRAQFPGGAPYLWLSGEAGMVKALRRHLVNERGIDKKLISFTGYWRYGKSEEQTTREAVTATANGQPPPDDDL
ncbi:MAG: siderophore-interacting protein [Pseudonocardiaceae bacterium]|nr:siderophore-interacting protein [Pseudonocardiaceae bacterium]